MIIKRILKIKSIRNNDFNKYHNEYNINYESWDKLTISDRVKVLENLIQSDNKIINDLANTKYNILPSDLKLELDKIKIEVYN